ncbi:MAG: hypothetical protein ACYTGS_18125, partial [Planctomycetota bacterium]
FTHIFHMTSQAGLLHATASMIFEHTLPTHIDANIANSLHKFAVKPISLESKFLQYLPTAPGLRSQWRCVFLPGAVYFVGGTPRSLHIFLARTSTISLCLGTADLLLDDGLYHQECFAPSLTNSQP